MSTYAPTIFYREFYRERTYESSYARIFVVVVVVVVNSINAGATCTENLAKFGRVVFKLGERTDRQTDILITILHAFRGAKSQRTVRLSAVATSSSKQ